MWRATDTPQWPTTWSATSPATLHGTIFAPCARPAAARACPGRPPLPWRGWCAARRGRNGAARRAGDDSWCNQAGAAPCDTPTTPSYNFSFRPRCHTPSAMSGSWVLGILVPSALISMWCLMWCCLGIARHPPPSTSPPAHPGQQSFKYNPIDTASPRNDTVPETSISSAPSPPPSPRPPPRTLPGLHFIHSTSINE